MFSLFKRKKKQECDHVFIILKEKNVTVACPADEEVKESCHYTERRLVCAKCGQIVTDSDESGQFEYGDCSYYLSYEDGLVLTKEELYDSYSVCEADCEFCEEDVAEPEQEKPAYVATEFRKIDTSGRLLIPKEIRDKMNVKPGDEVGMFLAVNGSLEIMKSEEGFIAE